MFSQFSPPLRVLLIDDRKDIALIMGEHCRAITSYAIKLEWISNPARAQTAILEKRHDLYLVDHNMGEGANGIDLIKEARKHGVTAPMILLTADNSNPLIDASIQAGATAFLDKTKLDEHMLEHMIQYEIAQAHQEHQLREMISIFAMVVGQLPVTVWLADRALKLVSTLGQVQTMPVPEYALPGGSVETYFGTSGPLDAPIVAHHEALKGEQSGFRFKRDGLWWDAKVKPFKNHDGVIIGCIGVAMQSAALRVSVPYHQAPPTEPNNRN